MLIYAREERGIVVGITTSNGKNRRLVLGKCAFASARSDSKEQFTTKMRLSKIRNGLQGFEGIVRWSGSSRAYVAMAQALDNVK